MLINDINICCDSCRKELNGNEVKRLRWESRLYGIEIKNMMHLCTCCQRSFDISNRENSKIESSCEYGV